MLPFFDSKCRLGTGYGDRKACDGPVQIAKKEKD